MLHSYQKAVIFQDQKGNKKVITQSITLNQIITKEDGIFNNVYIQSLYDDSIGILSNEGIKNIQFKDIQNYI